MNGTRCRFLSACPPCVKGGRGDWAVGTKTMAQSNAERYNVTVRIRIGFHRNELPTAQSLRPQCAHWGHHPLHKGGMRRSRASAINYNLSIFSHAVISLILVEDAQVVNSFLCCSARKSDSTGGRIFPPRWGEGFLPGVGCILGSLGLYFDTDHFQEERL